jgi:hypothetical protein
MRRSILTLLAAAFFAVSAQSALAGPPQISFAGGTAREQATVRSALGASSFDWSVLPRTITVHIGAIGGSYAEAGHVYLDDSLLDSGRFSWGVVQHEFAHQVDFLLFDDTDRAILASQLGGGDWCYSAAGLDHVDYGCERFASELAWAYWQSPDNTMSPAATNGESGALPVARFRALVAQLLGIPSLARVAPVRFAPKR